VKSPAIRPATPRPRHAPKEAPFLLALGLLATLALLLVGCSGSKLSTAVPAGSCDMLQSGTTYSTDLDADGAPELILTEDAGLTITDGELVYHSRDRWRVVDTWLGDIDQNGLLEVVTLLDDEEGRHIGLFAYFGGDYRERIVTSEIVPAPGALEVRSAAHPGVYGHLIPSNWKGDLVILLPEQAEGQTAAAVRVCRWNGFGFTGIQSAP
jgi:hypothetical protein